MIHSLKQIEMIHFLIFFVKGHVHEEIKENF